MASSIPLTTIDQKLSDEDKKNAATTSENGKDVTDSTLISDEQVIVPEAFNAYRNTKTMTQGLMDISLFCANANQLRYILEHGSSSNAFSYIISSLIIVSLTMQVAVGIVLLLSTRFSMTTNDKAQREKIYEYGNHVTMGIFLITIINVFIAAFGGTVDMNGTNIAGGRTANMTTPNSRKM